MEWMTRVFHRNHLNTSLESNLEDISYIEAHSVEQDDIPLSPMDLNSLELNLNETSIDGNQVELNSVETCSLTEGIVGSTVSLLSKNSLNVENQEPISIEMVTRVHNDDTFQPVSTNDHSIESESSSLEILEEVTQVNEEENPHALSRFTAAIYQRYVEPAEVAGTLTVYQHLQPNSAEVAVNIEYENLQNRRVLSVLVTPLAMYLIYHNEVNKFWATFSFLVFVFAYAEPMREPPVYTPPEDKEDVRKGVRKEAMKRWMRFTIGGIEGREIEGREVETMCGEIKRENEKDLESGNFLEKDMVCSICLCEYEDGDVAVKLPHPCGHIYHEDCLLQWTEKSVRCPLCNFNLDPVKDDGTENDSESNSVGNNTTIDTEEDLEMLA